MKTLKLIPILALGFVHIPAFAALSPTSEQNSIRAMQGCYEVTFHFVETFVADPNYPTRSKEYLEHGLEWVELDQDTGDQIALQHILLTPDGVQKHWRQEWTYQPTTQLDFMGLNTWHLNPLNPETTKGMWSQRVGQVDDSPRYDCTAPWIQYTTPAGEVKSYWECEANAPLPRREFSQRSDYQILKRRNRHVIQSNGWLHEQDNSKMKLSVATDILSAQSEIAKEKGADMYLKVEDARCEAAKQYWGANKSIWHDVQDMWKHIEGHHPVIKLKSTLHNQTLWMALFELAERAKTESMNSKQILGQAHDLIHEYMEE